MISRRGFVQGACGCALATTPMRPLSALAPALPADLARIEAASGGRLGVAVLDSATGAQAGHRTSERFPLCSTFKVLAAAAVLSRVDAGEERLDRHVRFGQRDLVTYSPVTQNHVGVGMPLEEICAAAITMSDNTAGNLLLASIDGPPGLTAYARSLGDEVTRLDRIEPELNEALPDDPRDTTAPAAMVADLATLLTGNALSGESRHRLLEWLLASKTGDARLRAGVPSGWQVGDKTGSGERGTANDVGIIGPPERPPVLVAVYLTQSPQSADRRNEVIASVGRLIAAAL
ncbi:MAG: class A beta-lactamase [Hyphomicrobiales bacterium]|nr:class A beta-lactamase [Hyphomicrobiales bacterium]